ncbi:Mitochondrial folate transporter/carrier [Nymphon striatum]|nr:Mitochondrial folate transporter/carrier [Nymphon striatum]
MEVLNFCSAKFRSMKVLKNHNFILIEVQIYKFVNYNNMTIEHVSMCSVTLDSLITTSPNLKDVLQDNIQGLHDGHNQIRPQYSGILNACKSIVKNEGFTGLYRGVTPNIWGAGLAWGMYFMTFNGIKGWMQDSSSNSINGQPKSLGPAKHMLVGIEAGVFTLLMLNPIWVVKTRLCLQYANIEAIPPSKRYNGMFDALFKLAKHEGITGIAFLFHLMAIWFFLIRHFLNVCHLYIKMIFQGLVPGLFGTSHGAIQFMTYEELKARYLDYYKLPADTKFNPGLYIIFAASSKLVAVSITYPYQVVRARLQDQLQMYSGVVDVIKKTWRYLHFHISVNCMNFDECGR